MRLGLALTLLLPSSLTISGAIFVLGGHMWTTRFVWVSLVLVCPPSCAEAQAVAGQPVNQALECNAALPNRPELAPLAGKLLVSGEPNPSLSTFAPFPDLVGRWPA